MRSSLAILAIVSRETIGSTAELTTAPAAWAPGGWGCVTVHPVKEVTLSLSLPSQPPIIDYEGSPYRRAFWEGQGREYEDLAERAALRRLLPPVGEVLIDAGAGFGRLADLYGGYNRVILMDYSLSLLQEARQLWGHDPRFRFVAASIYRMPFVDDLADVVVMVRVMHHLQAPALALTEIGRVLQPGRTFVLEYANKRHLKAILRFLLRRQRWNPFVREPYEFVPLNYDFHPAWMHAQLRRAGLRPQAELAVSTFRWDAIKRRVAPARLAAWDARLARPLAAFRLSPSLFVCCWNAKSGVAHRSDGAWLRCPSCGATAWDETSAHIICGGCGKVWPVIDGIYDFRNRESAIVSRETTAVASRGEA
jgi:SAM-dependent methyltransferase